jgi:CDP-glycerol glycerophosphotransferase
MKIDKANLAHWRYLMLFGLNVAIALLLRPFRRRPSRNRVILYGHKLGGNLLAIYRYLRASPESGLDVAFLTMDPDYHRELVARGDSCLLAISPRCIPWLVTADAIVSGHGLHALQPMLSLSDLKFFDVWHGIPYKGFDADDFRVQHRYDEVWVSSPLLRQVYIERFGFPADIVHVTGYARTDRLVHRIEDPVEIKRRLGLDPSSSDKLVLFAPTWKQDARNRSLFPFGLDEQAFLGALSELGERVGAKFLLRAHLNSGDVANHGFGHIVALPHAKFPDTEEILLVSDILVCDWSSIAFDYLVLDRPTIFLDVEAPFAKGLSLDASHRFGAVVDNMDTLLERLERYSIEPERYALEFSAKCSEVKARVYDGYADGNATARCVARLGQHFATDGSSR